MMAEATGVFFYVFPGIASVASFTLATTNPVGQQLGVPVFGSLFQIGWAFAIGIAFAIITCASTSGGHFNPAITLCFAIWQGFPWRKVPHYIFAQIFGAFIAGLLLMGCYWPEIQAAKAIDIREHGTTVYNGGGKLVHGRGNLVESRTLTATSCQHPLLLSQPQSNEPRISVLPRVFCGQLHWHRHLVLSRPCQSICRAIICPLHHRPCICLLRVGVCWQHDQHESGEV